MSFQQKYLKYKQKYIALKEQSSFAQGSNLKQKYIALKEQSSFAQGNNLKQKYIALKNQIGGGRFSIKMDFTRGPSWSYDVFFVDDSGRPVGLVGFTDGHLDGSWFKDGSYDGAISPEEIEEMRILAITYGRAKNPSKFPGGGAGSAPAVPYAGAAPVSSSTTITGDSGGNSSSSSSTTTTTAALAPGASVLSPAEIGLFTAIDDVNHAEVIRLISTGLIPNLNVRSPTHRYYTPLLVACFKIRDLPEGDPRFAALEAIILLLVRNKGVNVNESWYSLTPVKILDIANPKKFKTILMELKANGGVEETTNMYVPPH